MLNKSIKKNHIVYDYSKIYKAGNLRGKENEPTISILANCKKLNNNIIDDYAENFELDVDSGFTSGLWLSSKFIGLAKQT